MKSKAIRRVGVALGASMLAAATAASSSAEQTSSSPSATTGLAASKQPQARRIIAPARPKPASARHSATAANAGDQTHQWSIKDALPDRSSALGSADADPKTKTAIGRIPWRSGSLGFETESKIKPTEYPGGQKVPGYDTNGRQPPSYLGFSLSVPTSGKSMWPLFSSPD
jgi:hypothetical protein